jgi:hypothetical protein
MPSLQLNPRRHRRHELNQVHVNVDVNTGKSGAAASGGGGVFSWVSAGGNIVMQTARLIIVISLVTAVLTLIVFGVERFVVFVQEQREKQKWFSDNVTTSTASAVSTGPAAATTTSGAADAPATSKSACILASVVASLVVSLSVLWMAFSNRVSFSAMLMGVFVLVAAAFLVLSFLDLGFYSGCLFGSGSTLCGWIWVVAAMCTIAFGTRRKYAPGNWLGIWWWWWLFYFAQVGVLIILFSVYCIDSSVGSLGFSNAHDTSKQILPLILLGLVVLSNFFYLKSGLSTWAERRREEEETKKKAKQTRDALLKGTLGEIESVKDGRWWRVRRPFSNFSWPFGNKKNDSENETGPDR